MRSASPPPQVDLHYNGFCNTVLWQLFHYVPLNIDSKLSETRTLQVGAPGCALTKVSAPPSITLAYQLSSHVPPIASGMRGCSTHSIVPPGTPRDSCYNHPAQCYHDGWRPASALEPPLLVGLGALCQASPAHMTGEEGVVSGNSGPLCWAGLVLNGCFGRLLGGSVQFQWAAHQAANQRFGDVVLRNYCAGDVVWVQDYHLMLLPAILKQRMPKMKVRPSCCSRALGSRWTRPGKFAEVPAVLRGTSSLPSWRASKHAACSHCTLRGLPLLHRYQPV